MKGFLEQRVSGCVVQIHQGYNLGKKVFLLSVDDIHYVEAKSVRGAIKAYNALETKPTIIISKNDFYEVV